MKTLSDIRHLFTDYFVKLGHSHVSSSPLVPQNDPTLLFTNAGMVQFKDVFTGQDKRPYVRATTSQKCLRAGGKHNDLENVGYTARHHTFFEMLGNFSFGDYFKEDAIKFAWDLITKEFHLPADRLYVTVYSEDHEAASIWKKITGFPEHKIIRIPTSDNFWSMGDRGPCGPCTEIFYDHGEHIPGGLPGTAEEDGDRFIEIWNLVFMQFDQIGDGKRVNLPKPSVDTGMGIERISAVLQGVHDNYDIDLFKTIINESIELTGTPQTRYKQSHRVIADHLRASCFLIADGVLPSNEGRGYVLRRIMRRAMRHAHLLGAKEPLMWRLVSTLIGLMGTAYPELIRADTLITTTLRTEEEKFRQTLDRGLKLLVGETEGLSEGDILDGSVAFKLYDTYGFPLDLTQDVLKASGLTVDTNGFEAAMEEQKATARAAWVGSGDVAHDGFWLGLNDDLGNTEFLGYESASAQGLIQAIIKDGKTLDVATAKEGEVFLITNQTPFYAESGGQMGDAGVIESNSGQFSIRDTIKKGRGLHVHIGTVKQGTFHVNEVVKLYIDIDRRDSLRAHHSATHLAHEALRKVLGTHVAQKGSLVEPTRLRFDFTHTAALTHEELLAIEKLVNAQIVKNLPVVTQLMKPDEAIAAGAMALFGERYGDEVRVVSMGENDDAAYSVELCGGTHVRRTGDIGFFKITSESSISAGIRRIEAVTHTAALTYVDTIQNQLQELALSLKSSVAKVGEKVASLALEKKDLLQEIASLRQKLAMAGGVQDTSAMNVGAYKVMEKHLKDMPSKDLKSLVDQFKKQIGSGVILLTNVTDGKVSLLVGVTEDLTEVMSAVKLVQIGSEILGGKGGGGRPDMAQAGGSFPEKINEAMRAITEFIAKHG